MAGMAPISRSIRPKGSSTTTTRAGSPGPTKTDCERAGCLSHCAPCEHAEKGTDPWLYALAGTAVGGVIFGGVLYYVGKNRKRRR